MAGTWLTDFISGNFTPNQREIIHLTAKVAELEALNALLDRDNTELRARLRELELDSRETQRGLLTRLGVLPPAPGEKKKERELEPVRKAQVPWNVQAARLEADSRERYWKKVIEEREKPQEARKVASEEVSAEEAKDIEELSK